MENKILNTANELNKLSSEIKIIINDLLKNKNELNPMGELIKSNNIELVKKQPIMKDVETVSQNMDNKLNDYIISRIENIFK